MIFAEEDAVHAMSSGDKWMVAFGVLSFTLTVIGCTWYLGRLIGGMKTALDNNTKRVDEALEHGSTCDTDRAEQRVRTETLTQWVTAIDARVEKLVTQ